MWFTMAPRRGKDALIQRLETRGMEGRGEGGEWMGKFFVQEHANRTRRKLKRLVVSMREGEVGDGGREVKQQQIK